MAADDEPLTKLQICKAALQSNLFPDSPMPKVKCYEHYPRGNHFTLIAITTTLVFIRYWSYWQAMQ